MRTALTASVIALLTGLLIALPAQAVIKPDQDLIGKGGVYSIAKQVLVGKVTAVNAAAKTIDVEISEDLRSGAAKGGATPFEKTQRINVAASPEVAGYARVGGPAVLFVARIKGGLVHVADCFCPVVENPAGTPPTWTVARTEPWSAFTATTPALIQALRDLGSNKGFTNLNGVPHWMFPRYRKVTSLQGKPALLACGDANGDGIPDLVGILESGAVEFHVATAGGYSEAAFKDATAAWGLAGVKAKVAALGDVNGDGKADLLLDGALYVSAGSKFTATKAIAAPTSADWLAAGIGDCNGNGKADAALVTKTGDLYVFENGPTDQPWKALPPRSLWKEDAAKPTQKAVFGLFGWNQNLYLMVVRSDGPTRYPAAVDDERPADVAHLALAFKGDLKADLKCVALTGLRTERSLGGPQAPSTSSLSLMIYTPAGASTDIALMGRGYGTYLMNARMGFFRHSRGPAGSHKSSGGGKAKLLITPVAATCGDFVRKDNLDELIFAVEDGGVYLADNVGAALAPGWRPNFDKAGWDEVWVNETP
jgi:hypothetical protein